MKVTQNDSSLKTDFQLKILLIHIESLSPRKKKKKQGSDRTGLPVGSNTSLSPTRNREITANMLDVFWCTGIHARGKSVLSGWEMKGLLIEWKRLDSQTLEMLIHLGQFLQP